MFQIIIKSERTTEIKTDSRLITVIFSESSLNFYWQRLVLAATDTEDLKRGGHLILKQYT